MRQRFTLQMGKVAIAAMPSFAGNPLPPILKAFRDRYAGINVAVHDVINEQVFEMIAKAGWRWASPSSRSRRHPALHPLCRDRFLAVVPKDSALARKAQVRLEGLLTLDFITLQRPSAVRLLLEQELARSGRTLEVAFESHQLVTVGHMVANGLRASAVPALWRNRWMSWGRSACR